MPRLPRNGAESPPRRHRIGLLRLRRASRGLRGVPAPGKAAPEESELSSWSWGWWSWWRWSWWSWWRWRFSRCHCDLQRLPHHSAASQDQLPRRLEHQLSTQGVERRLPRTALEVGNPRALDALSAEEAPGRRPAAVAEVFPWLTCNDRFQNQQSKRKKLAAPFVVRLLGGMGS